MAIRNILKEGDETLLKVCRPVEKFDARLAELLGDMAETMHSAFKETFPGFSKSIFCQIHNDSFLYPRYKNKKRETI